MQPHQLLPAESAASRVLEPAAPPRLHGLREIATLFRDSVPGSFVRPSSSSSSSATDHITHSHRFVLNLESLVIFSYVLQNSIQAVSISIVAQLGSNQLSVAAFSLMLAFVTG